MIRDDIEITVTLIGTGIVERHIVTRQDLIDAGYRVEAEHIDETDPGYRCCEILNFVDCDIYKPVIEKNANHANDPWRRKQWKYGK